MNYKVLIINLKRRPDRKKDVEKIFNDVNFNNYFFYEAIDNKELVLNLEIKNLFKGNDFGNRKSFIGCALSHYNIWIDLLKDIKNDYYIIFEDDFSLHKNFIDNLNITTNYVDNNINNIDFLFLGYHRLKENTENKTNDIFSIINFIEYDNYIGGFFSYIITKKGANKILNYINTNGIKHGIDYLIKINNELNIYEACPNIAYSSWVNNTNPDVDSDIQKNFETFDFNALVDYNNYKFIKNMDIMDNDLKFIQTNNINELIHVSNSLDPYCDGFNTLGFLKIKIDINKLEKSNYLLRDIDGIFIKLDRTLRLKLICNWTSPKDLCDKWNRMSKNDYKWNNIKITWEDDDYIDYYVIINKPYSNQQKYIPKKTIIFQMEPRCKNENQNWGIKTWGEWENPDPSSFLHVRTHLNYYNNCEWQLNMTYEEFMNNDIKKEFDYISTICSSKYFDPGHIKRVDFLKYIENKKDEKVCVDIFGDVFKIHNFSRCKGSIPEDNKKIGIIPYKYYFMAENNQEHNYITEKIWEPIISECLCFYWGSPNISDYIDPRAYIALDLNNFEESFNIIKSAIVNDLWSERINIIRQEKYKILNYYNFFPTLERIITNDLWKNELQKINKKIKIYMICNDQNLNYKAIPLINTLKEFDFIVDIYLNKEEVYEDIIKQEDFKFFLLLDDQKNLISSLNNLFNHILYIPENADLCQLTESINYSFKIMNQYNSLYYYAKRYLFKITNSYILSKKGCIKIMGSNYEDLNFYVVKHSLF